MFHKTHQLLTHVKENLKKQSVRASSFRHKSGSVADLLADQTNPDAAAKS